MQQMLNAALLIAAVSHDGQFDKAGKPYLLHVLRVMNNLNSTDEELNCIAVLHDVIEDTATTYEQLREVGMSERVIAAVALLTKVPHGTPEDYLAGILSNEDAMLVKMADLQDNMDLRRLKGVTEKDMARMNKYVLMYHAIDQRLKELHNDAASVPVAVAMPEPVVADPVGFYPDITVNIREIPMSEFDRWMGEPAEPVNSFVPVEKGIPAGELNVVVASDTPKTYPKSIKDLIKHRFGTPEPKPLQPGMTVRLKGDSIRDRWGRVIEVPVHLRNREYTLGPKNGIVGEGWEGFEVELGTPLVWVRSDDVVPA